MKKPLLLLAIGAALAASVAAVTECLSCGSALRLAWIGVAWYACLLVAAICQGAGDLVRWMCAIAAGFHLGLVCASLSRGSVCPLCLIAALGAFVATAASFAPHRPSWSLLPVILPWAAAFGLLAVPPLPRVEAPAHTRIVAYTRADCAYCDELRDRVLPEAVRGLEVEVQYRDAGSADFVRRAPTLLLTRGARSRVLEGLPTVDRLRDELSALGGTAP